MNKVIKIFDPNEKLFGWLSNNYKYSIQIENKEWYTVTNYIYAKLLKTAILSEEIRLIKNTNDIKATFDRLYKKELDNITKQAIEKGLKVKFENKYLAEKLLATGNSPILYVSNSTLLGIGPNPEVINGQNLYGRYLMQIRHMIRVSFKKQKQDLNKVHHDQIIYDTYLAEKGLIDAIQNGNNLKEFINKTPSEIIEVLGRIDLENKTPDRDVIIEMAHKKRLNKDTLDAIDYPTTLVLAIRKKYMRELRLRKIKERKEIIFDMYADYLLEKQYPDLDADKYPQAKEQELGKMGWQQKNDLENRLYELFKQGMLSSRLSDSIDERLAHLYIPSEEDVMEAETFNIQYEDKKPEINIGYIPENGDPVLVYANSLDPKHKKYLDFSPISFTGMLNIDAKLFPTISHYITASLLAHIPIVKGGVGFGGMNLAYPQILENPNNPIKGLESFLDPNTFNNKYMQLRDINYRQQLEKYAREAINKKFENRFFQDILLMTDKSKIIYNDFSNPILGVGGKEDKGGMNFVGKYLMELRTKFVEMRKGETLPILNVKHITYILDKDPFMKEWIHMRVKDMCKVIMIMKQYLYSKDEIDIKINVEFTTNVLDKIYQPCSQLFGATELIKAEVPQYFRFMVQNCPGFTNVSNDIIEIIWKRIAVMMYYLIKYLEDSNIQNIRTLLGRIELLVSKGGKCINIVPDEYDNCIISALINLIKGISVFNKQFSYSNQITELDVKTAASIILNADISDEIKPIVKPPDQKPVNWIPVDGDDGDDGGDGDDGDDGGGDGGDGDGDGGDGGDGDGGDGDGDDDNWFFPDDDNDVGEIDYDDMNGGDDDGDFSPHINLIIGTLKEIDEIKDPQHIAMIIEGAVETIKTYPMSKQIKNNRINFFSNFLS